MVSTVALLRRALLGILVLGLGGTLVELLLLGHTDGIWQLIPVVLVSLGLAVTAWFVASRGIAPLRALQILSGIFIVSGLAGTILHYICNIAYEHDSNPSLSGAVLYRSALSGSTPALAPGTMIQLGLIGLLFAFRHPVLGRTEASEDQH